MRYMLQLTLFDFRLFFAAKPLLDTDVRSCSLPACVQILLVLGDKFVSGARVQPRDFDLAFKDFTRKIRLKLFWHNKGSDVHKQNPMLPAFHGKSEFCPRLDPGIETELVRWEKRTSDFVRAALARRPSPRQPYVVSKAFSWIREQHNARQICKISADKGYGPCIVSFCKLERQYKAELVSGDFQQISKDQLVIELMDVYGFLNESLSTAAIFGRSPNRTNSVTRL